MITKINNLKDLNKNTWNNINNHIIGIINEINLGKTELIHFVGIGGIGMSGLALIMNSLGFEIQGSDIADNKNLITLRKKSQYI